MYTYTKLIYFYCNSFVPGINFYIIIQKSRAKFVIHFSFAKFLEMVPDFNRSQWKWKKLYCIASARKFQCLKILLTRLVHKLTVYCFFFNAGVVMEAWLAGVTVKNIPTCEIIPPVYFCVRKSVKNILGVCLCIRQYIMGNTYDML